MILDTIARSAGKRVERRKQVKSLEQVMKAACECREREDTEGDAIRKAGIERENRANEVHPFKVALSKPGVSFICGAEKASPSKGLIAPDFPYVEIVRQYQEAGTDAVSILAEPEFFLGADRYLEGVHRKIELPLLREDFAVDKYQIYGTEVLGAFAILLIRSLMDMEKLERYIGIYGSLGLSSLAETHTDREVAMAVEAGADIIGINNRNLETFEVDFMDALRLRKLVDRGIIFMAESGVKTPEGIELLTEDQVDTVLVGETLMRASGKERALRELRSRIGWSRT